MSALKGVAVLFNLYYVVTVNKASWLEMVHSANGSSRKKEAVLVDCIFFNNVRANLRLYCSADDAEVTWKSSDQIRSDQQKDVR